MEQSIVDCHDRCEQSFEELIDALQHPERDFGEQLSLATIKEEYGRFKVWRGNVGAHHDISRRISLEYRLRDSKFYRDKIIRHLNELNAALDSCAELIRGERLPLDECASPTESSVVSDSEYDDSDDDKREGDDDTGVHSNNTLSRRTSSGHAESLSTLRNLLDQSAKLPDDLPSVAFAGLEKTQSSESVLGDYLEPEVVQLRSAITDILSHLYKLSMLIRRPVPQDRLVRSAKIDVKHFHQFDDGYVQDCFPCAKPWLQKRLSKAITRRRQHLIYNRKHHEHLARPRAPVRTNSKLTTTHDEPGPFTAPKTVINAANDAPFKGFQAVLTARPLSTRFGTSIATPFIPPRKNSDKDDELIDWEAGTQSSYASTLGSKDQICIPPRPKDEDGNELTSFECPYCFRIQEIHSSRGWRKHVLTDLTPYVCTFENCTKAEAMFESRSEWHTHELQFHRREWQCGDPNHKVYERLTEFETHLRQGHRNEFSEAQFPIFIKSCEQAVQKTEIECPLCTDDDLIKGDGENEPVIRRNPKFIPSRVFKRHLGRHLERLSLFAISSTEEEADEEESLPSNNLNSGVSRLSWIDSDLSSSSAEGSTTDSKTDYMIKLASPPNTSVNHSVITTPLDELSRELEAPAGPIEVKLPCKDVRPHSKNPNFIGRKETFAKIQEVLDPNGDGNPRTFRQIFALCGSGGVGKTQTALNYVFEEMDKFEVVLWAHASSKTQLIHSFSNFAAELGLISELKGKEKDPTLDAEILKAWFNEAEVPWLLIIDAADSLEIIDDYLPTGRLGSILITSRNASYVPKYGGMVLGTLDEANAVQLLLESLQRQGRTDNGDPRIMQAAANVVKRLGYFPLAIIEAAHYIASNSDKSIAHFIDDYEQNELAHTISQVRLDSDKTDAQPFKLSILWRMSFSSLTVDQQTLLNTISFLDPTGIPLDLISTGARRARGEGSDSLGFLKSDQRFRQATNGLIKSSLVMQNEHAGQLWIHQLYQESAQARMDVGVRQRSWNRAVAMLDAMWPVADRSKRRRTDLWPEQTKYLPHVQSLAFWYRAYSSTDHPLQVDDRLAYLLVQAASFCLMRGFFDPVDSLLKVVDMYCAQSNTDSERLLFESYWAKGGTQLQLNDFAGGLHSFECGYAMLQTAVEKGLIPADDDRLAIASGLMGNGRMGINDFDGAEEWYLKAFHMWETMHEEVFKDKQLFISNMAVCHTFQGRFQEAEELILHSLRDKEKMKGFKLADTLYTLGNVRIGQKDYDKAFINFKEAYSIFAEDLGERHRLTANCRYCLAWLLNRDRKYNSAIAMFEQALDAYEENPYYRNECTRTKYMLGTVQLKHGDAEFGQKNIDAAREMAKEICPHADVMEWTENDYDLLVMAWSR